MLATTTDNPRLGFRFAMNFQASIPNEHDSSGKLEGVEMMDTDTRRKNSLCVDRFIHRPAPTNTPSSQIHR